MYLMFKPGIVLEFVIQNSSVNITFQEQSFHEWLNLFQGAHQMIHSAAMWKFEISICKPRGWLFTVKLQWEVAKQPFVLGTEASPCTQ